MKNLFKYPLIVAIAGVIVFALLYLSLPAFAGFGETILYVALIMTLFTAFDKYVLKDIDTIEELKSKSGKGGNIAYAIFILAIAVLFLAVAILVG